MKLSIPVFLALLLLLILFSFAHTDAVSAASEVANPSNSSAAILTSTISSTISAITATGVVTPINLTGMIVSGTGVDLPADLPVTLYGYQAGSTSMDLVLTKTTTINSDGSFSFDGLSEPDGLVYMTSATYAGVPYHSSPSMGEPMTITVYDVTTSTGHLTADQLHLIFGFTDTGELQVMEVYILSNVGAQTIVGGSDGQLVMDFPLPSGATNPDFRSGVVGEAELTTYDGFWETTAVRPGGLYGVSYAFSMPYSGKATLSQPVVLPINAVGALLPAMGDLKIESAALVDNGLSDFGGTSYHIYSGDSLQTGAVLSMNVSGNPNAAATSSTLGSKGSKLGLIIGLGAFGLVLILAGVWISRRNQIATSESEPEVAEDESLEAVSEPPDNSADENDAVDAVMDDIIALDDLYQAGELRETAYRERRAELKEKLRIMLGDKE